MWYQRRKNKIRIDGGGLYSRFSYTFEFPNVETAKEAKKALDGLEHPKDFDKSCEILAAHGGKVSVPVKGSFVVNCRNYG